MTGLKKSFKNERTPRIPNSSLSRSKWSLIFQKDWQLYLMVLPAVIYIIIFNYIPMYGVQIAFKDYSMAKGIWGSPWCGFKYFERFFQSYQFWPTLKNTLVLSLYSMIASFPLPIVLALMLNAVKNKKYKSLVQTVTYAPHFISLVVVVSMMMIFLSPRTGFINYIIKFFGGKPQLFMGEPAAYKHIYVWSGVWQGTGWASIIYIAALSSISPELYEAATMDGANRWHKIAYIDLPGVVPTAIILLIMSVGQIMSLGFDKAYLLQTPLTEASQEIISTYTYKVGLVQNQYSYSSAIGLFNTVINIILIVTVNQISKKVTETSLW